MGFENFLNKSVEDEQETEEEDKDILSSEKLRESKRGGDRFNTSDIDPRDFGPDEKGKMVSLITMFREYNKDGEYMGPDPPKKYEQLELPEEEWHDKWVDHTGNFTYSDKAPVKETDCPNCGAEGQWTGRRARHLRCRECGLVMIDKMWEDDRYENPNKKSGVDEWL